jgi:hypothetical protein
MSPAASGLLRGLIARAGAPGDRILLTDARSIDWQSLTFVGERHEIELRICGPDADTVADRLCDRLPDAEFAIPGQILADIAVRRRQRADDGSALLSIEALTIEA